jgi:hypothetical protein
MNIPTAEDFFAEHCVEMDSTVAKQMIEFAKLHVAAALKEVLEVIPCLGSSTDIPTYKEMEEAVLNAYPFTNIK